MLKTNSNKSEIYKNKLNLSFFTISRGVFLCSLLITGIITSRLLGPENRGAYSLFFTSVGLGLNFTNIGLSQSNIFFLNKKKKLSEIYGNSIFFSGIILIIGLIFCLFIQLINLSLNNYGVLIDNKFLLLGCIFCGLLESSISGIIFGLHKLKFQSINQIIYSSLVLCATFLIYFFNSAEKAIFMRSIACFIHIIFLMYVFSSKININVISFNMFLLKNQLYFGSKNWIQNLIGLINNKGTIFIVASFSNFTELGLLSVALLFSELIRFMPDTIGTLLLPRLSASNDTNESKYLTAKLCRITLFFALVLGIIIGANLNLIIRTIFGKQYLLAVIPSIIVIFGALFSSLYQLITRFFTSQNIQQYSIFSSSIGLLVSITVGIPLIPQLGSMGGALSYSIGSFSTAIMMLIFFCKYTKMKPYKLLILTKQDLKTIYNLF